MTAYQVGRIFGVFLALFILMLIIASIYYVIKRPNKPFQKVLFSQWVIIGSIILYLFAGNTSRNPKQEASHVYPNNEVKEFILGCLDTTKEKQINSKIAENFCSCSITEIQKVYTYGEFKKVAQDIEKSKNVPPDYKRIITSCTRESKL